MTSTHKADIRKPGAERGNIFFMLFGAVAVVGVLGAATVSLMRGPLSTMVEVNRRTMAESQMSIASKLGMMTSSLQANNGDCEAVPDGFVEPYEWEAASNAGPDGVAGSEGGGWLSGAYGVSKKDPWGTNYGYCVWDAGATVGDAGCGGAGQKRLAGSGTGDRTYPVMALISAGPDRTFQTGCVSFATGDANNNGVYDSGEKLVVKAAGSDDVVLEYTYAEASVTAGGLWELKAGAPDVAQTPKNIEVGGGANFAGGSALIDPTTGQGTFPRVVTDFAQPNTAPTIDFVSGLKLSNTGTVGANCSTGSGGPGLGTLAVDSATSTALLGCLDDSGTPKWFALGGVNTEKWKDGTDAGDIHYPGGFVGIGTVDPDKALDVVGDASLTGDFFLADTKSVRWGDATTRIQGSGPGSLEFLTGGSTRFSVDSNGLAGLGVAPAASTRLIIQGTGDTSATVALNVTDSNAATILYVQDDKKVGIGTTPNDALDVAGAADVSMGYKIDGNTVVYVPDTVVENILVGKDAGVLVTGDNNTVVGGSAAAVLAAGTDNIVVGQGAAELLDSGNFNTLIGQGIGPTLTTGERNILIGSHDTVPIDVPTATTNDYLNIGNTIYGHMDTDKIGIGVADPTEALDVAGNVKASGDVSGANLVASSSVMVGTDIVGPVSTCSGANKLQYSGGNWVCSPDLQGGSGAGTPPTLEDVLSNGDDANGQDARDLGTVAIGSGTVSGTLKLDVSGDVGATQYCDEDGANCFTAASVGSIDTFLELIDTPAAYTGAATQLVRVNAAGTGLEFIDPATLSTSAAGNTGEIQFNNGGVFAASANLFWDNAAKELGIGTNVPGASLDVATTDAILFPRGTTAEQPATPVNGMMRYNSTANKFEVRENGSWRYLQTGTSTSLAFTDLSDTPAVYTGAAYKLAMVNPTETGMIFSYNDAVLLPVGATADRPAAPVDGMIRYNSDTSKFEVRQAGAWVNMVSAATPPGGNDREVQFNDAGALGGATNFVYTATGYLGVGTAAPKAPFHVAGEAIIGPTSGLACDADRAGGVRYNAGGTYLEYCNGTTWRPLIGSASGTVLTITPAADTGMDVTGPGSPATGTTVNFIVTNVGDTTSSALSYTITGLNPGNFVVTGENCTGATLAASATCQISIQPQTSSNGLYSATLTVPEHNAPFASLQGTGSGFGCVEGQAAYGGRIAKCDAFGAGKHFVVTPGGCTDSTTPTCAGGNDTTTKAFSNVNGNDVTSLAASSINGPRNTVNLMQLHNAGGTAPAFYHAAAYCAEMNYGGYTDWYLPAPDELVSFFYPNRVVVGGYVGPNYWSSSGNGDSSARACVMINGVIGCSTSTTVTNKAAFHLLRCARREGMTEPAAVADTTPESTVIFPTAFAASAGVRTSSSVVTVTGITPGTAVSVSGPGSPTIKINGGAEVTSGTVKWNDTVQVVMDSPAANARNEASVTIGTATLPFSVITRGNCGGSCAGVDKRVFVTSTTYNGNLGGLAGADAKCQTRADAATLGGTWRAILSGSSSVDWAANRMDYNWNRLVNMNGQMVATSPADLWDGTISAGIGYDETGASASGLVVNTGIDVLALGGAHSITCSSWTTNPLGAGPTFGTSGATNVSWANNSLISDCATARRLYCQEVTAPGVTLAITPATQSNMDVTGPGAPATGTAVSFTVQNTGTGPSAPLAMSMDNVTNFEILNDTCTGNILAASATCTLDVRPRAYANGTYSGVLTAASSGAPSATAALDGTASGFLYTAGQWYLGVDPGDIYYSGGPVGIGTNDPDVSLDIVGTDAIRIPVGTTAQQPTVPLAGMMRYNSTTNVFEGYVDDGTPAWEPINTGAGGLWTDLTGGRIHYGTTNANQVGVGTNDPKAPLHVAGEVIVGPTSGLACDADRAGGVRYNAGGTYLEYCNGTTWRPLIGSASGTVLTITPAADTGMDVTGPGAPATGTTVNFIVTNVGDTTSSALSYTITGLNPGNFVVTGENCTGATLAASATCQISIQPQASGNGSYSATLTVPEHNAPFASLQGTGSGFGCVEGQAAYGGVIAKCDAFGAGKHFIVTPGGCTDSTTPTCAGGNDTTAKAWSNVNANDVASLAGSAADGPQNTVNLMQLHNAGGSAPAWYHAAAYCADMNYGGYTDWYLPAQDEMVNFFYPNRVAVGGYVSADYWTTNSGFGGNVLYATKVNSSGVVEQWGIAKTNLHLIRCARREGVAEPAAVADTTPDAITFPTAFAASAGVRTSSSVVTVTGITPGTSVSVSGPGNPTIKINGGAEVASGTVKWNDTVQIVMDSPAIGARSEASVTIGTATLPFSVITRGNCGGSCAGVDKRVFVTSTTYGGNLGGLAGADTKCQTQANAASLGGTWRAILSSGGGGNEWAANRMDYNWDRLVNMNGQVIATSPADLWDGTIANPIQYDENNVLKSGLALTGSNSSGAPEVLGYNFCENWTAVGGGQHERAGQISATTGLWVASSNACWSWSSLYCQEVTAPGVTLAITPAIQNNMDVTGPGAPATGSAVTFTVENTGTGASAPLAMSMDNVTNFEILNDTCTGNILAAAATCTLDVRPRAYANGTYNGVLSAASSGAATATAALSGTASGFLYTAGQWYLGVDLGDIYYSDGPVGIGTNDPDVSLDIVGTDAIRIPVGTSAQQPTVPLAGMMRYNSTTNVFEGYVDDGTPAWEPINTGAGGLWTDLTGGRIHYGTTNANQVGVGTNDPKAPLHVAGEVIVGPTSGLACDADRAGGVRYNAGGTYLEYCNGTTWRPLIGSASGTVLTITPAADTGMDVTGPGSPATGTTVNFIVTNVGDTTSSALSYTITGLNPGNFVVTGENCTGATLAASATCQISIQPQASSNGQYSATLTVPEHNAPFASLQGTGSGFGCVEGQAAYGGVIAKCDAFGAGKHFVVTPGGCTDSTTPTCAGGSDTTTKQWSNLNGNTIGTIVSSTVDGPQNTVNLMQLHNAGGTAPAFYHAAAYCANMNYGGYTDWYLPAGDELANFFYPNRVAVGGYAGASYMGSTEAVYMSGAGTVPQLANKTSLGNIRCARREGMAEPAAVADTTPESTVLFPTAFAASAGVRTSSAAVTVTGITPGTAVSVSGSGSPTIKINGGAEVTSGTVKWNDTVQVVMDSPAANARNEASVTIGTATLPFSVITRGNCGSSCAGVDKRVFVTSTPFNGNFGGVAGGDTKCQQYADAASLGGTWRAVISGSASTDWAIHRMDYNWDRLVNMNGQVIATSPADLWDGSINNSISYDENVVVRNVAVWSGADSSSLGRVGESINANCVNWTSSNGAAWGFSSDTANNWLGSLNFSGCSSNLRHLYCAEVTAPGVTLAITPATQNNMDVTGPGAPATGVAVTFTVENTGTGASAPLALSMDNVTNFEILNDTCTGNILAPAATCTLDVRPRAYANGTYNGVLSAASSGAPTATAALDGTASAFLYTAGQWYLGVDLGDIYYSDGPVGIGTNDPDVSLDIVGTDAIRIPVGTSAQQPTVPLAGMMRYNSTTNVFEGYVDDGTPAWEPINTGAGGLWTDLTGGRIHYGTTNANQVGVGTNDPKAPLHVAGEVIVGPTSGLACDADRVGALRWDTVNLTVEMCDGSAWKRVAATVGGTDFTPDAFSFTDVTDQSLGQLILSNVLNITGMDAGTVVSVSGAGTPQISINGGAWVTSGTIDPGQTLRVRLTSDTAVSTARVAAVTVGTVTDNWSVTTKAGNTRIFATPLQYAGNMGGIGGAHTICQSAAAGLGYGGIWRALLSNDFVDAKDLLTLTYPVVRASDAVTVDATNLWDGGLTNSVNSTGASNDTWTGTLTAGDKDSHTCENWRNSSSALEGNTAHRGTSSSYWVNHGSASKNCDVSRYIYCVEQAAPIGVILGISPGSSDTMFVSGPGAPAYSAAQTFTVENAGDTTSATMATSLSNTTNFEFTADTCNGNTLAQGATCTVSIRAKADLPANKGAISSTFTVTANNNPSIALSGRAVDCTTPTTGDEGAVCADGTVYAGLSGAGTPMYVTRCDAGMTWDGSACTGTQGTYYWNGGNNTNLVATSQTGFTDGKTQTANLITIDSDSATGGTQLHQAAQYCADLVMHGYDDWYLPARTELSTIYANREAIGNFDMISTIRYWSSSENNTSTTYYRTFSSGMDSINEKYNDWAIRCARRDGSVTLGFTPASGVNMDVTGPGTPAYGSAVTFTLTNSGTATSGLLSSSLTNSANFEITADTCAGNTLAASATCTIDVRPVASANGNYAGSLVVTHPAGSVSAGLSGVASGFGSAVVGYWTAGIDAGDIYYSTGPVGIGTNDPDVPLDVVGKIRGDVLALRDVTGAAAPVNAIPDVLNDLSDVNVPTPATNDVLTWDGTNWIAQAAGGGTGALTVPRGTTAQRPGTPVNGMIRYNTTVEAFEVYENGAWVAMGAAVSDVRLKTDIKPLNREEIVAKLMQIDTYSFRLKADQTGRENMGVIAQEIEKIFPDLVDGEGEAIRSVHYVELIAPLIETAQYLKIENDAMRADVSDLKDQVALLNKAAIGNTGKASMDGWAMLLLGLLLGGNVVLLARFGRGRA